MMRKNIKRFRRHLNDFVGKHETIKVLFLDINDTLTRGSEIKDMRTVKMEAEISKKFPIFYVTGSSRRMYMDVDIHKLELKNPVNEVIATEGGLFIWKRKVGAGKDRWTLLLGPRDTVRNKIKKVGMPINSQKTDRIIDRILTLNAEIVEQLKKSEHSNDMVFQSNEKVRWKHYGKMRNSYLRLTTKLSFKAQLRIVNGVLEKRRLPKIRWKKDKTLSVLKDKEEKGVFVAHLVYDRLFQKIKHIQKRRNIKRNKLIKQAVKKYFDVMKRIDNDLEETKAFREMITKYGYFVKVRAYPDAIDIDLMDKTTTTELILSNLPGVLEIVVGGDSITDLGFIQAAQNTGKKVVGFVVSSESKSRIKVAKVGYALLRKVRKFLR